MGHIYRHALRRFYMDRTAPVYRRRVLILCLIVLERLTRRKWPWRFKATVTYVCDGDSVWVKRTIGGRVKLSAYMLTNALRAWEAAR